MWTDPGTVYVNGSQTHECGNWDGGRTIPFLGIHNWDFRCSAVRVEDRKAGFMRQAAGQSCKIGRNGLDWHKGEMKKKADKH